MSIPAAFLGVVLIWATTPLAIKWSSEDAGYLIGVASRMVLGGTAVILAGLACYQWGAVGSSVEPDRQQANEGVHWKHRRTGPGCRAGTGIALEIALMRPRC